MLSVGHEYADDCSARSTNHELTDEFERTVPQQLKDSGLCVYEETIRDVSTLNKTETTHEEVQYY